MTALDVPTVDPAAVFAQLYADLHAPALARIRRQVGSHETAEDILQETWRKVIGALPEYLGRPNFHGRGLVFTTADRLALDHLRKGQSAAAGGRAHFTSLDTELASAGDASEAAAVMVERLTPEVAVIADETSGELRGLLGMCTEAMPAGLRRALWLQVYGGLSMEAIGATLGTTEAGVKGLLFRARGALRSALERERRALRKDSGIAVRMDRMVDASAGATACWSWQGAQHQGHPWLFAAIVTPDPRAAGTRRMVNARRLRWARLHGPLPPWARVVPSCAARGCTNPDHLRAVTRLGQVPATTIDARGIPDHLALTAARLAAGLTQRQVSAGIGCTVKVLADMERAASTRIYPNRKRTRSRQWAPATRRLDLRRRVAAYLETIPVLPAGPELRRRRLALRLTGAQVAAVADCTMLSVYRAERGDARSARTRLNVASPTRTRIAAALDRLERERAEGSAS